MINMYVSAFIVFGTMVLILVVLYKLTGGSHEESEPKMSYRQFRMIKKVAEDNVKDIPDYLEYLAEDD